MKKFLLVLSLLILANKISIVFSQTETDQETIKKAKNLFFYYSVFLNLEFAKFCIENGDSAHLAKDIDSIKNEHILIAYLNNKGLINKEIADTFILRRNLIIENITIDSLTFLNGIERLEKYCYKRGSKLKYFINEQEQFKKKYSDWFATDIKKMRNKYLIDFQRLTLEPSFSKVNEMNEKTKRVKSEQQLTLLSKLAYIAGFISCFMWILIAYLWLKKTDSHGIPVNIKKYVNEKRIIIEKEIDAKINEINTSIQKLEAQVFELSDKVSNKKSLMHDLDEKSEKPQEVDIAVEPPKARETFYLPFPDPSGFFWDEKKSTIQQNDTPYVLEIDPNNSNKGELSLVNNRPALIRNAITSADTFLKPVCRINGPVNGDKITVIEKGKLEKKNEKWLIAENKKMIIQIHT